MKNIFALLLTIIFIWNNGYCIEKQKITPEQKAKLEQLKMEVSDNLNGNILSFWTSKMVDEVNGGFYGRADFAGKVYPDAEKGGILNARILWTYSSAYRVTHNPEYLQIAKRAKEYILAHFIDSLYGGAYRSLNVKGEPYGPEETNLHPVVFYLWSG